MIIDIKIPSPGESISEVEIANWIVDDGSIVERDQEVAEIESDKATLPLLASEGGKIKILMEAGDTVNVGAVACTIDTDFSAPENKVEDKKPKESVQKQPEAIAKNIVEKDDSIEKIENVKISPLAKNLMQDNDLSVDDIINGLRRITRQEVEAVINSGDAIEQQNVVVKKPLSRDAKKTKMSSLRKKLSKRLVAVKNETAMLTTFNEADMSAVIDLRKKYQKKFVEKHGVKLGFMSFFIKAASQALEEFPSVNSMIDGTDIISYSYSDIAVAVQTPKGLMVPVIRNSESKSLAELEKYLIDLAGRAREGKITLDEMTGGTFTITNGGVFGSLLSTPILNPPQSGILGMHNIVERPIAVNGQAVVRPMMYLALSYDHRVVDGKDSVGFLLRIKELIESPQKFLFNSNNPDSLLLDL